MMLCSCEKNGLTQGDPDYWTESRHQFIVSVNQPQGPVDMYFLDRGNGTAALTFDGSNPLHWKSESEATVSVETYTDTIYVPETVMNNGQTLRVTAIGEEAFMGCRSLTKVVLPSSVVTIEQGAFAICFTLAEVNIPDGVKVIPSACFAQCKVLRRIELPSTVESVGHFAFYNCLKLMTIGVNNAVPFALTESLVYIPGGSTEVPVLLVPSGAASAYEQAEYWKELTIIEGED